MRKYLLSTALLVCGTLFALPFSQTKECSSLQGWDEISQNWQTNQFGSNFMHSTFFLGTGSFPGTGTGAIPDGPGVPNSCGSNGANLDVSFNVSGLTGAVTEVSVDVTMTHTWIADVTATLIAPDGTTSLVLFGRTGTITATACGDSSNLGGTYLFTDDAVSTNWWAAAAAIGDTGVMAAGSYRTTAIGPQTAANFSPETSLNTTFSTLADANGTWILRFTDGGLGDTGAVSAANLHIETEETEEPGGPIEECNNTEFAITDNASISSVINITESGTIGTDANLDAVIMDIQHTFAGDLEIVLISPTGTEVALSTDNGSSTGLDTRAFLTFTDTSTNNVTAWTGGAPLADYKAEGGATTHPVAAGNGPGVNLNDVFAGQSITGNWTLRVFDDAAGDVGILYSFCLNFTVEEAEEPGGPIEECNNTEFSITDNSSISSVINITESGTIGTDANLDAVIMDIQHTFAGDLEIVLISPAGTEVALSTDNGSSTGLDTRAFLRFMDTSTNNVTAWTGGSPAADYRAEGGATTHPVAAGNGPGVNMNDEFAGESITGNWTLRVFDDAAGDVGTLYSFCLNFTVEGSAGDECEWTVTVSGGCGDEVSWTLVDALGAEVLSGGPYACATYTDTQTITAEGPVEFYIESIGSWGDNTPFYSIANENGVILSGTLAGGTESTFSDLLCSDMPPPAAENDNCGDVTPTELTSGVTTTFTGTTVGGTASPEETAILGAGAVWEAVTLTAECSNLTIDFCGTPAGNMDTAFVVYTPDCPATSYVAGAYEFTTCGDGNVTYRFTNLPAGTYYLPVLSDASYNTLGDYTMNVIAEECFVVEPPAYDCYQGDGMSSNGFENGYNVTAGGIFRNADDFVVDGTFNLQYIRMNLFMNPGATAGSTTFNVRADESGMPSESNIVATFTATPTSQVVVGGNFGFNVSQVEYILTTPVDIAAGTYWLQPEVNASDAGPVYWEVTTTGTLGGFIHGSESGAAWTEATGEQAVFFVAGVCEELPDGCFVTGQFDQWPTATYNPSCSGIVEVITATAWAGEYSKVQVTAGTEYIFSSSVATDFITIADEDEEIAFTTGTGSVTWTSPIDQVIRFYTHADEDCTIEEVSRTRAVQCGEIPPPPANDDCEDAIALSCGDSDSGSTLGANNSGGNLAGDVFYSFTGSGTPEVVTVSLCASSYDTFLRVFSDCTLSNEVAFNDDFCGLQSQLSFISDGTSTYIIMVEGYDVNVGDYVIEVTCSEVPPPPADCEDNEVLDNGMENGYFFTNSLAVDIPVGDAGYTVEGAYITVAGNASTFSFIFYTDNSGMPGTQVATANGSIIGSEIIGQNFGFDFIKYNVDFDAGVALDANTTYWMQVQTDATAWDWTSVMSSMIGQPGMIDNGSGWASADGGEFVYQIYCEEMGIGDMNSFDFSYYPNPVKDFLNIESKKAVQSIDAFNLAGQKVMSDMKLTQGKLNISNLSPGTYVLRATLEGGQVETFKVIKK